MLAVSRAPAAAATAGARNEVDVRVLRGEHKNSALAAFCLFLTLSLFSIVNILFHNMGWKSLILVNTKVIELLADFWHVLYPT